MIIQKGPFLPLSALQEAGTKRTRVQDTGKAKSSFGEILSNVSLKEEPVRFSRHAAARLRSRDISMTDEQLTRLNEGKVKAGEKGIQDSLIMVDDLAFIVNIPNNTVVTAMDQGESDSSIFTNIDGAVIN